MSGLSYLCQYGDDTETDEISETELFRKENITNSKQPSSKPRLPPPNLSGVSVVPFEEHIDDPSLHGGRIRNFQHVRGNWATFVYIEYPDRENLIKAVDKLAALLATVDSNYFKCDDIHVSLSKTFVLKYHMITAFTSSLQEVLSNVESFELGFESVEVYCNEDKTRTFVGLKVDIFTLRHLLNISKQIDTILEEYRLPKFYEEPSFHVSVLSVNGNKKEQILNILTKLNETFNNQEEQALETIIINRINCKSGNKFYQFYLK